MVLSTNAFHRKHKQFYVKNKLESNLQVWNEYIE